MISRTAYPPIWSELQKQSRTHVYPRDVEIFHQRASLDEVYYVESGIVKIVRTHSNGQEVIFRLSFPGTWLGIMAVIANTPTPVSAITCTPTSLMPLPAETFRELLKTDREFSVWIHELHARQLCRQAAWVGHLTAGTSRQRLQAMIYEFVIASRPQDSDRSVRVHVPLRHWELASLIAVTPEHLSRLLAQMRREGIIRREKGWVILSDLRQLTADTESQDLRLCDAEPPHATLDPSHDFD